MLYCKRVDPAHRGIAEACELVTREAAILGHIARTEAAPFAARVLDEGADAYGPYLLLEPARGVSVAASPAPRNAGGRLITAAFRALAALHDAKAEGSSLELVHGDISPENVLYTENDVRFVDWELGRCKGVPELALGPFRGTLAYVAPEVAAGERPTQAADVFSLALTLLECLSGRTLRKLSGAAGILEAAETPIDVAGAFAPLASPESERLRDFFDAVLASKRADRPPDGAAALALL